MITKRGNLKVKVPVFSLPEGLTCNPNVTCYKHCYSKKASCRFPNVKSFRMLNLLLSTDESFIAQTIEEIKKASCKLFRIHADGDFYSTEYILKWFTICMSLPEIKFLAMTKQYNLFTSEILSQKPNNLTLLWSTDPIETELSHLPNGFNGQAIVSINKATCPSQIAKIECGSQCTKCWDMVANSSNNKVYFKKH